MIDSNGDVASREDLLENIEMLLEKNTAKDKAMENLNQQIDQLEEDLRAMEEEKKKAKEERNLSEEEKKLEEEKKALEAKMKKLEEEKERFESEKAVVLRENETLKKDKEKQQAEITMLQDKLRIQGETISNTIQSRVSSYASLKKPIGPPPLPTRSPSPPRVPQPITHTVPTRPPSATSTYSSLHVQPSVLPRSQSPGAFASRPVASVAGTRVQPLGQSLGQPLGQPLGTPSQMYQRPASPIQRPASPMQRPVSPMQRPAVPLNPAPTLPQTGPS